LSLKSEVSAADIKFQKYKSGEQNYSMLDLNGAKPEELTSL
jgi:hypothetical protein